MYFDCKYTVMQENVFITLTKIFLHDVKTMQSMVFGVQILHQALIFVLCRHLLEKVEYTFMQITTQ